MTPLLSLPQDRYFSPDPAQKQIAQDLYNTVATLPLICPHGHVDAQMFADPDYSFGTPTSLFITPDHYIFRMFYAQGVTLESLGIPRIDGGAVETDPRKIWQIFADHFYLFRGTPTGMWLAHELREVFGIQQKLTGETAQDIYEQIASLLQTPEFRPRTLFEHFNVEVLCTTDLATSTLEMHRAIRESGWQGRILPTFRPDAVVNLDTKGWLENIQRLGMVSGIEIGSYGTYIQALEHQRAFFKSMGAVATDHAALEAYTDELSEREADAIFQRALHGENSTDDIRRFTAHMLIEMARMSVEDGLVMQIHVGSLRDHNSQIYRRFGQNQGGDIPIQAEFTYNLHPLLNRFGNDSRLTLIMFTLDESTYSRELAPLAGHYPALKLGPPWWFYDSLNGIRRYFDQVIETAGLYNTCGFNDDTRAFPSIPARHDLWRRAACDWIAGLVVRGIVDLDDGLAMSRDCATELARVAYKL
ncbi:MAG: glucuronate isomerase [Chloroflexota bacterium]